MLSVPRPGSASTLGTTHRAAQEPATAVRPAGRLDGDGRRARHRAGVVDAPTVDGLDAGLATTLATRRAGPAAGHEDHAPGWRRGGRARETASSGRQDTPRAGQPVAARPARASTTAASVGVAPRPSRAPTRAACGGSRNVDGERRPGRLGEDLGGRPIEQDAPGAHDDDAVEGLGDEAHVVADGDDRPAGRRDVGDDAAGRGRCRGRPGRSSARPGRRPACPWPAPTPGPAACAASSPRSYGFVVAARRRARRPSRAPAAAAATSAVERPRMRGPKATSSRTLPREDLAVRVLEDDPDAGRERRDPLPGDVDAVVEDAPLGRAEEAVESRTSVDLPLPFWPTMATRSPGAMARSMPASARVPSGYTKPTASRRSVGQCHRPAAGSRPRAASARASRTRRRRVDAPARPGRGSSSVAGGRTVDHDRGRRRGRRPASTGRRAGRSCARRRAAPCRSPPAPRSASPTRRVPSGSSWAVGSSRTRWRGRMASSEAMTTSWPWPPDRRRGSRSARCSMPSVREGGLGARRRSRAGSGPGSSGRGRPPRTPSRSRRTAGWPGSGSRCRPGSRARAAAGRSWARRRSTDVAGQGRRRSSPARDREATRHSVDLPASLAPTRPTISPSSRRRSMSCRTGLA